MKQIFKIVLTSSVLFLIAILVSPSYAMKSENNTNEGNNGLKYRFEIHKSAVIITWNQPLDSTYCTVYSKDHHHSYG